MGVGLVHLPRGQHSDLVLLAGRIARRQRHLEGGALPRGLERQRHPRGGRRRPVCAAGGGAGDGRGADRDAGRRGRVDHLDPVTP